MRGGEKNELSVGSAIAMALKITAIALPKFIKS
jgi:hypothetical protein